MSQKIIAVAKRFISYRVSYGSAALSLAIFVFTAFTSLTMAFPGQIKLPSLVSTTSADTVVTVSQDWVAYTNPGQENNYVYLSKVPTEHVVIGARDIYVFNPEKVYRGNFSVLQANPETVIESLPAIAPSQVREGRLLFNSARLAAATSVEQTTVIGSLLSTIPSEYLCVENVATSTTCHYNNLGAWMPGVSFATSGPISVSNTDTDGRVFYTQATILGYYTTTEQVTVPSVVPTLSLSATPVSGVAPLTGVDIAAVLGQSASSTATFTLSLDCGLSLGTAATSLGVTASSTLTFNDLCSYTNAGIYIITGTLGSGVATTTATTSVTVSSVPAPITIPYKELQVIGPLVATSTDTHTQSVTFTLASSTEVMVFGYANAGIPNSVAATASLSLDGVVVDSTVLSSAATTGGATYSTPSLAARNLSLSAGTHTLTFAVPAPGVIRNKVDFYVYAMQPVGVGAVGDMALVGPLVATTDTARHTAETSITLATSSDAILFAYFNAGIPNSVLATATFSIDGTPVRSASISDASITGGATRSLATLVARQTLTAGVHTLKVTFPAPGFIFGNKVTFYAQLLNTPAATENALRVLGPLSQAGVLNANTQSMQFTAATTSDALIYATVNTQIPNSVSSTISLKLDGVTLDAALISDAAITGGGTRTETSLIARVPNLAAGIHTINLAFPLPGRMFDKAQVYVYLLDAVNNGTTTPVTPPTGPVISCPAGVLTTIPSGANVILAWATSTASTTVLQSSADFVTWTNVSTPMIIQQGCNTVTEATTTPVTFYRLFDTTPVVPAISCAADVLTTIPLSSTTAKLAWATSTASTTILQSSTDLITWATSTLPITTESGCFTVTTAETVPPTFYRLFDTSVVIPPVDPVISCAQNILTTYMGTSTITVAWATSSNPALVLQSSTDFISWNNVLTPRSVVSNCFTVTEGETVPPTYYRLFQQPTTTVAIVATPTSGTAPLNNVDVSVALTDLATTSAYFTLSCRTNGVIDYATSTVSSLFAVADLCSYSTAGTYLLTAELGISGPLGTATSTATTSVTVTAGSTGGGTTPTISCAENVLSTYLGTSTITVAWATSSNPALVLQSSMDLSTWSNVSTPSVIQSHCFTVTEATTTPDTFYRLFDTTPVFVATLTPSMATGTAPLNNIGFTVGLAGSGASAVTPTQYSFDCTSDGVYDAFSTTPGLSFVSGAICSYPLAGTYTAKVLVEQGSNTTIATTTIGAIATTTTGGGGTGTTTLAISCPAGVLTTVIDTPAIILAWATSTASTTVLQSSIDFSTWTNVIAPVVVQQDCNTVTQAETVPPTFYRLFTASSTPILPTPIVNLSILATPASSTIPFNVGFDAAITGTATGTITYRFDCTSDGIFDSIVSTSVETFSTGSICSYTAAGTYVVTADATRGVASSTATTTIRAFAPGATTTPELVTVSLSANPSSGTAPLNNVDFVATIGNATSTYYFTLSCRTNGVIDFATSTSGASVGVPDICSYQSAGTYTATASVGINNSTTTATTVITVTAPNNGGGGGGGGGGGVPSYLPGAVILATTTPSVPIEFIGSCSYVTGFLHISRNNDPVMVTRLQNFLNLFEGEQLTVSGTFDRATEAAVRRFQDKYATDVLYPWGTSANTGYVYITTSKKINDIYCANFPGFVPAALPALIPDTTLGLSTPIVRPTGTTTPAVGTPATSTTTPFIATTTTEFIPGLIGAAPEAPATTGVAGVLNAVTEGVKTFFRSVGNLFR